MRANMRRETKAVPVHFVQVFKGNDMVSSLTFRSEEPLEIIRSVSGIIIVVPNIGRMVVDGICTIKVNQS
jgi:hypothetical protein